MGVFSRVGEFVFWVNLFTLRVSIHTPSQLITSGLDLCDLQVFAYVRFFSVDNEKVSGR